MVLFQRKAWMDRPTAHSWAAGVFEPYVEAKGVKRDRVLFMDNLDAQARLLHGTRTHARV